MRRRKFLASTWPVSLLIISWLKTSFYCYRTVSVLCVSFPEESHHFAFFNSWIAAHDMVCYSWCTSRAQHRDVLTQRGSACPTSLSPWAKRVRAVPDCASAAQRGTAVVLPALQVTFLSFLPLHFFFTLLTVPLTVRCQENVLFCQDIKSCSASGYIRFSDHMQYFPLRCQSHKKLSDTSFSVPDWLMWIYSTGLAWSVVTF